MCSEAGWRVQQGCVRFSSDQQGKKTGYGRQVCLLTNWEVELEVFSFGQHARKG